MSIAAALQKAITHHQAGQWQEAEQLYSAILQVEASHPDANHNLGLLLLHLGHPFVALPYLRRALATDPDRVQFLLSISNALLADEQAAEAARVIEQARQRAIFSSELAVNLGNALRQTGATERAMESLREAVALDPRNALAEYNLAATLQDAGHREEAVSCYRHAVALQPGFAEAQNSLGLVLRTLGRTQEAEQSFRAALTANPDYALAHYDLAITLSDQGRFEEALTDYREAIRLTPESAEACNDMGIALQNLNRLDEALSSFRHALTVAPAFAAAHNNLGNLLHMLGKFEAAIAANRHALEIDSSIAEFHNNLGNVLRSLNDFDNAKACFLRAIELKPEFALARLSLAIMLKYEEHDAAEYHCRHVVEIDPGMTEAWMFLAELLADKGEFHAAEFMLQRAICLVPDSPEAWAALAGLRKMTESDAGWLAEAERIANSALTARKETYLRYALGKYYDDVHDYKRAFPNYHRANELTKSINLPHDRQGETAQASRAIATFDQAWLERMRAHGNTSVRPVFIVGMPRSGTTLAEQIIAAHPMACGVGELSYWQNASAILTGKILSNQLKSDELSGFADGYLKLLASKNASAERVVDKMPSNFQCLGLIHAAFPHARIIHMQRNPIDTCLSIYFQHFESYISYANDLDDLAHCYREYQRLMQHWNAALPPATILTIPYEQLVADPEHWVRTMLDFVDLPWDPRCLEFHQRTGSVGTTSKWQVRQKINRTSVERWRHYADHVAPLLSLLDQSS